VKHGRNRRCRDGRWPPRANLIAASTVSARIGEEHLVEPGAYLSRRSASTPASVETSSLHQIGQMRVETLFRPRHDG